MLAYFISWLRARFSDEKGQSLVEYGLIIALIAIVVIGALVLLGDELNALFQDIKDGLALRGGSS